MRNRNIRLAAGAAALAVAASVSLTATASASHAHNSAFALSATGPVTIGPLSVADSEQGPPSSTLASYTSPDGTVTATALKAEASAGHAKASVADLRVAAGADNDGYSGVSGIRASAVTAQCSGGEGSSDLANISVGGKSMSMSPPANTGISMAGVSVLLNKQHKNADGSLTVTAISISAGGQTLDVGSVTCGAKASPPPPTATSTPTTAPVGPPAPCPCTPSPLPVAPNPTPAPAHLDVTG